MFPLFSSKQISIYTHSARKGKTKNQLNIGVGIAGLQFCIVIMVADDSNTIRGLRLNNKCAYLYLKFVWRKILHFCRFST